MEEMRNVHQSPTANNGGPQGHSGPRQQVNDQREDMDRVARPPRQRRSADATNRSEGDMGNIKDRESHGHGKDCGRVGSNSITNGATSAFTVPKSLKSTVRNMLRVFTANS
jgi:hypothetical protein